MGFIADDPTDGVRLPSRTPSESQEDITRGTSSERTVDEASATDRTPSEHGESVKGLRRPSLGEPPPSLALSSPSSIVPSVRPASESITLQQAVQVVSSSAERVEVHTMLSFQADSESGATFVQDKAKTAMSSELSGNEASTVQTTQKRCHLIAPSPEPEVELRLQLDEPQNQHNFIDNSLCH